MKGERDLRPVPERFPEEVCSEVAALIWQFGLEAVENGIRRADRQKQKKFSFH